MNRNFFLILFLSYHFILNYNQFIFFQISNAKDNVFKMNYIYDTSTTANKEYLKLGSKNKKQK